MLTSITEPSIGSKNRRFKALASIRAIIDGPIETPAANQSSLTRDLAHADQLITRGVTVDSWTRNASWAEKFRVYVRDNAPSSIRAQGLKVAAASDRLVIAFLANVSAEQPLAKTRVGSAKRAVNLIRAMSNIKSANDSVAIQLLSKAAKNIVVSAVRQSPAVPISLMAIILRMWGRSPLWWKRQTVLMILLAICTFGRGDELCSCLRLGVAWVRMDGSVHSCGAAPTSQSSGPARAIHKSFRGFMLLFPTRKNRQATPSWIPVAEQHAISMLAEHISWLATIGSKSPSMFLARRVGRTSGSRCYLPNTSVSSQMSTSSFRNLFRSALQECCAFSKPQAGEFGTHSFRLAAMEMMRKRGMSAELRQQMGDWMSEQVALRYLQLDTRAQFNIIEQS